MNLRFADTIKILMARILVLRYMPAYVLYLDEFRKGPSGQRHLRMVLDRKREILEAKILHDELGTLCDTMGSSMTE